MSKVRIAFVGVGTMGQCAHLKYYSVMPECEVVALAEIRPELGRRVAQRYGVAKTYPDHTSLLENEAVDGIVAIHQFQRHGSLVPELLKSGVPVLTEKPLASTIESGEKIVEAVEQSRTWQMVAYHKRSDPAVMYAKSEIERLKSTGELGKTQYVRITMPVGDYIAGGFDDLISTDEPIPELPVDSLPADMDLNAYRSYLSFVNYYIHQVNLLRYLLGEPYKVSYADPAGMLLVAHSESGVPGVIEMSPYSTSIDWQETALVAFEHGYVKIGLPAPLAINRPGKVEILRDPGNGAVPEVTIPQLPFTGAMKQQAANFIAAIRGEMQPTCQAKEALEDLRVAHEYMRLLGR